jgi:hypothetical protein
MTIIEGRPETPEEAALREWFDKQALAAPDNLEAAARQIVTLVTSLLTILFAVLAVAGDPLPAYLSYASTRWLGAGSVVALLLALAAALGVIYPFRRAVDKARPDEQRAAFRALLDRKSRFLRLAIGCFLVGLAALGVALVIALFNA